MLQGKIGLSSSNPDAKVAFCGHPLLQAEAAGGHRPASCRKQGHFALQAVEQAFGCDLGRNGASAGIHDSRTLANKNFMAQKGLPSFDGALLATAAGEARAHLR